MGTKEYIGAALLAVAVLVSVCLRAASWRGLVNDSQSPATPATTPPIAAPRLRSDEGAAVLETLDQAREQLEKYVNDGIVQAVERALRSHDAERELAGLRARLQAHETGLKMLREHMETGHFVLALNLVNKLLGR